MDKAMVKKIPNFPLAKRAQRVAVALNPNPVHASDWPNSGLAYRSQRNVAYNVIWCIEKLDDVYQTTSISTVIKHIPKFYDALTSLLIMLQSTQLQMDKPRNYKLHISAQVWRAYQPVRLKYTYPVSLADFPPSQAAAKESENLYKINHIQAYLNRAADLCLDFAPALIPILQAIHIGLGKLLLLPQVRPQWTNQPKFTVTPLDTTYLSPVPARFFKPKQNSPEWRRQQREQWHKEHGTDRPNQTSAKRKKQDEREQAIRASIRHIQEVGEEILPDNT